MNFLEPKRQSKNIANIPKELEMEIS